MGTEFLLRVVVMCVGVVIILIALLRLTETNPFVAIVALIIGAMLAVLGLLDPRVKSLGGSGSAKDKPALPIPPRRWLLRSSTTPGF